MTAKGEIVTRTGDELSFEYRSSNIPEPLILEGDVPASAGRSRRDHPADAKNLDHEKVQPAAVGSVGRLHLQESSGPERRRMIDQAGLKGTRIGGAEISDRHANFVVTHEGAKSDDVLRLIDLARSKVSEQFGVDLDVEIQIW